MRPRWGYLAMLRHSTTRSENCMSAPDRVSNNILQIKEEILYICGTSIPTKLSE